MITPYYQDEYATLYHGDCRNVLQTLGTVDHTFTDPPYGAQTHSRARTNPAEKNGVWKSGGNTGKVLIDFAHIPLADLLDVFAAVGAITRRWVISFLDWSYMQSLETWCETPAAPLRFVRFGIWDKPNGAPQFSGDRPATGWEAIAILHQKDWRGAMQWNGGGKRAVWTCNKEYAGQHKTQKPLHLLSMLISDFTNPDETIFDPFAGVGSTGVAAKRLRRRCILIEQDERYCAIAAKRLREAQPMMDGLQPAPLLAMEMEV